MLQTQSRYLLRLVRAACSSTHHRGLPELQCLVVAAQQSLSTDVTVLPTPGLWLHNPSCRQQQQQQQRFLFTDLHSLHVSHYNRLYSTSDSGNNSSSSTSDDGSSPSSEASTAPGPRGRDMGIVFTCAKCDTRSVKTFSRQSYERGLVLIRCPGCQALHLIADHLGWFEDTGFKIDEYLAAQGQKVRRVRLDDLQQQDPAAATEEQQVSAEDVLGWSKVQQLLTTVASAAAGDNNNSSSSSSDSSVGGCCGGGGDKDEQQGQPSQTHHHHHQHDSNNSTFGSSSSSSSSDGSSSDLSSSLSTALNGVGEGGVMDVSPEDVQAWVRVQQQQQEH